MMKLAHVNESCICPIAHIGFLMFHCRCYYCVEAACSFFSQTAAVLELRTCFPYKDLVVSAKQQQAFLISAYFLAPSVSSLSPLRTQTVKTLNY